MNTNEVDQLSVYLKSLGVDDIIVEPVIKGVIFLEENNIDWKTHVFSQEVIIYGWPLARALIQVHSQPISELLGLPIKLPILGDRVPEEYALELRTETTSLRKFTTFVWMHAALFMSEHKPKHSHYIKDGDELKFVV